MTPSMAGEILLTCPKPAAINLVHPNVSQLERSPCVFRALTFSLIFPDTAAVFQKDHDG